MILQCSLRGEHMFSVYKKTVTQWLHNIQTSCKNLKDQARPDTPNTVDSDVVLLAIKKFPIRSSLQNLLLRCYKIIWIGRPERLELTCKGLLV